MNGELYTLIAMAARYWFCGLMVLIAFRAWRITVVDNRRAALLRAWSPETGCIGEFVINPGRTKRQLSVPVPREGVLGSSRRADVRIPGKDVARFHLTLEQREGGLLVRPSGKNRVVLNESHTGDMLFMRDGDTLTIGKTKLLLVVFDPESADEPLDDFADEVLWGDEPGPEQRRANRDDLKDFEDELWPDE